MVYKDSSHVNHIDYLQTGRMLNGQYYVDLTTHFEAQLQKKQQDSIPFKVYKAPLKSSAVVVTKLAVLH